jgi:hypothetical protein
MKIRLLTFAITAAVSGQALSFDLDNPSSQSIEYASETEVPLGGAPSTVTETVSGAMGFGITDSASRFLRYDLPGTTFLELPGLAIPGQSGSQIVWVSGGVDTDFVIFEVVADDTTSISPTDIATLSFGPASPNLALDGEAVLATFGNYFTAPGALNQDPTDLLATSSGTLFAFVPGTDVAATTATTGTTPLEIDVTAFKTRFVGGGTRSAIGAFYVAEVPGDQFLLDGITDMTVAASRTSASKLRVSGDFSATADSLTGEYLPGRVFLSNDACATSFLDAESVTADEAVLPLGNTPYGTIDPDPSLSSGPDVCIEVNGVDIIPEADYSADYEPVSAAGFDVPGKNIFLGSLRKNGASDTQNLVLTPMSIGGVYEGYVRVSNTAEFAGDVFFRLVNDLGESGPSVPLADVIGSGTSRLEAGASTQDIEIGQIYAASVAADPSWSVGSEPVAKLRLITSGDFDSIAVTLTTISLDETLITTFQD